MLWAYPVKQLFRSDKLFSKIDQDGGVRSIAQLRWNKATTSMSYFSRPGFKLISWAPGFYNALGIFSLKLKMVTTSKGLNKQLRKHPTRSQKKL